MPSFAFLNEKIGKAPRPVQLIGFERGGVLEAMGARNCYDYKVK